MCKVTQTQIAADGQAVANAILSIANSPAIPATIAADLKTAAAALVAATSNWQTGTPVQDINTAAAAIEAILGAIPVTAPYASFVAIAVAALDILIGNLSTQTSQGPSPVANAKMVIEHTQALPENQYRGAVRINRHAFEGPRTALVRTWNDQVDAQPELGIAKI